MDGWWEYCALPMPTMSLSDSDAHFMRTSMCPLWSGWNLPMTREFPE